MGVKRHDFYIKLIDFWKRNRKRILVILTIWAIVIIINTIIKNRPKNTNDIPRTTYTPETSVMDDSKSVPKEKQQAINDVIDTYINYCNNKEYDKAYNMISDENKKRDYTSLEAFKTYVDYVFGDKKKIYYIQSYSIIDNKYVYTVRIMDDILANGTSEPFYYNGEYYDGYYYYEEKVILTEQDGTMKLSIGQSIDSNDTNIIMEDEFVSVKITNKVIDYDSETYSVQIDNKTSNYIVISDNTQNNEIIMNYSGLEAKATGSNGSIIVSPNSFVVRKIKFDKYYDDGRNATSLKFGAIRVLKDYDYSAGTTQDNLDNALKLYSLEIPMNN